jgi:hypothetical protein
MCPVEECGKVCKSKAGLKRHTQIKHPEIALKDRESILYEKLCPEKLLEIIKITLGKIKYIIPNLKNIENQNLRTK